MLVLAALGWLIAAVAMTALWVWHKRTRQMDIPTIVWPALVGALAVFYATVGTGAWVRRSAMAWMLGSWGARLTVQGIYTRASQRDHSEGSGAFWRFQALAAAALIASMPALLASLNRDPTLSSAELAGCAIWIVGFAGETTADRQRVRFAANPDNIGRPCRIGLWRYSTYAHGIFESLIWVAYAIFGMTALSDFV